MIEQIFGKKTSPTWRAQHRSARSVGLARYDHDDSTHRDMTTEVPVLDAAEVECGIHQKLPLYSRPGTASAPIQ
jgi:hypothetical protein